MECGTLVSAIIPVFNCERYLAEAIDSVLAQTHRTVEIVVIDDGSTDGSALVAQSYGSNLRYWYQPNAGVASALNSGARMAKGEMLAFLGADDIWLPQKLHLQISAFSRDSRLDMVFGHVQQFYSLELDDEIRSRWYCPPEPMPGYGAGTMCIRSDSFWRVGPFATTWRMGEFLDWHAKATDVGLASQMLPDVVMRRRLHGMNMGIQMRDSRVDYLRIVKAALDRRRGTGAAASNEEL